MNVVREYRWSVRNDPTTPTELEGRTKKLADELNVSPILADILVRRGIDSADKSRSFFSPSLDDLHDPFLMDGMETAVSRILRAVEGEESIVIYGDYDVDGTSGTALLWTFFSRVGAKVRFFIPDRIKHGYGLSIAAIDEVRQFSPTLLVAVDCGVTAVSQVAYARSQGIDVIICDHHEPADPLPQAYALLDPLKPGCAYPYKYLCGCGVAFKLVHALILRTPLATRLGADVEEYLHQALQLVALATVADIVPLTFENRSMVKIGMEAINSNPAPGIRALIDTSGLKPQRIATGQVVFVLAPRINAVGRLGDAMRAVRLLTSESYGDALTLAQVLENENMQRRKIDEETFVQAQEIVNAELRPEDTCIVLHRDSWHPGVIGIVASRLVERYYRPVVLMTTVDGVAKGSARSVSGFNIYEALKACQDSLIQFGGHKYAAGLTVNIDKLNDFSQAFRAVTDRQLTREMLTPEIRIEAEMHVSDISPSFIRTLGMFAPFGPENMRPVFATRNVDVVGSPRIVGKDHLKFKVRGSGHIVDAIGFGLGRLMDRVQPGRKGLDLAFSLDEGEYAGQIVPQLKIRDLK